MSSKRKTLPKGVAAGDFDKAVEWQEKAMHFAPEEENADCPTRPELYESGKPYRDEQGV